MNPPNGPNPLAISAAVRQQLLQGSGEPYPPGLLQATDEAYRHLTRKLGALRPCPGTMALRPAAAGEGGEDGESSPPPEWMYELLHLDHDGGRLLVDSGGSGAASSSSAAAVPGALVAAALAGSVLGTLRLRPAVDVKPEPASEPPAEGAVGVGGGDGDGGWALLAGALQTDVVVEIRPGNNLWLTTAATHHPHPAPAAPSFGGGGSSGPASGRPPLFSARLVAADPTVRADAERACLLQCQTLSTADTVPTAPAPAPGASHPSQRDTASRCLALLRAAGQGGLTLSALATQLPTTQPPQQQQRPGILPAAPGAGSSPAELHAALEALQLYGLLRHLPGYNAEHLVASEHSQRLVHERKAAGANEVAGAELEAEEGSGAEVGEEAGGGAGGDVPLRPWLDHEGNVNVPMLSGLVRRVLALVDAQPGLPEGELVAQLGPLVCPSSVGALLAEMAAQGRLAVAVRPAGVVAAGRRGRPSLLPPMRGGGGGGDGGGSSASGAAAVTRHYFPMLGSSGQGLSLRVLC